MKHNSSLVEKLRNDDSCVNNTHNESVNCDNSDLDNLKIELGILKTAKKIIKHNDVHKKVKTVNVLSSTVDLKSLETKLSFDNNLNNEWLERCCKGTLNVSIKSEDLPENNYDSLNGTHMFNIPEDIGLEVLKDNKDSITYSSDCNIKSVYDVLETVCPKSLEQKECLTPSSSPHKNEKNDELSSKCQEGISTLEHPICSQDDKYCTTQLLSNNDDPDIQEEKTSKKRKLTRIHSTSRKPENHLER